MGKLIPFQYFGANGVVPTPIKGIEVSGVPSTSATGFPIGTIAVDPSAGAVYALAKKTGGTATWAVLGGATSDVNKLTGDSGGAISPSGGNITLAGTANQIVTAGAGNTITWSLPAAIIAPGSLTATTSLVATTTCTADTFITSSATLGVTWTDNSISPSGSDSNINLLLSAKGTGNIIESRGLVGDDVAIQVTNTDNTDPASRAGLELAVGGTSAGDPYINFLINGSTTYTMGIDNSASDAFTLSKSATLGTTNLAVFDTDGSVDLVGPVTASSAFISTGTNMTFNASPIMQTNANTGGVPTGATGDVNLMYFQGGEVMQQFIIGAGQTIIAPRMNSAGLLTSLDLTNAEGAEYNFGILSQNKHQYTIGTSAAFYIELQVTAADVGGLDPFLVGFRKNQANDGTYTNYTDFAAIGARATTAADVIVLATDLNNAGETYTNTTDAWTDGQTKTLKVLVDGSGNVTYTIDGAAPTATAAFQFDSGDVVVPFIHHVFGAATPGAINWVSLKIGLQ